MSISEKLVEHIEEIHYDQLPKKTINKAKLCLMHTLDCSIEDYNTRSSKVASDLAKELADYGTSSVWFYKQKSNAPEAAFSNATIAQSILQEDIHRESNTHPGVIIIPTILAL